MAFVDPYFDESIGDLRNLLGAKSSKELKELEPQIVFANELELESTNIPRTNDLSELLLIHKQLFKGIYDWAELEARHQPQQQPDTYCPYPGTAQQPESSNFAQ